MTLETILNEVEIKRPELTRQEARAIATDILYSGEQPADILASNAVIDKLIDGYRTRQAAAGAQSVAANDPTVCPVCKLPLKPVKLANDRTAVFCQKHFVVFPTRPTEGK
jgi:hypothetical protein